MSDGIDKLEEEEKARETSASEPTYEEREKARKREWARNMREKRKAKDGGTEEKKEKKPSAPFWKPGPAQKPFDPRFQAAVDFVSDALFAPLSQELLDRAKPVFQGAVRYEFEERLGFLVDDWAPEIGLACAVTGTIGLRVRLSRAVKQAQARGNGKAPQPQPGPEVAGADAVEPDRAAS